jgi:hypothetical protein
MTQDINCKQTLKFQCFVDYFLPALFQFMGKITVYMLSLSVKKESKKLGKI